jgi:hypothetical protein
MSAPSNILDRIIEPHRGGFSEEHARYVLSLGFTPEEHARYADLAAKAQEGFLIHNPDDTVRSKILPLAASRINTCRFAKPQAAKSDRIIWNVNECG